MILDLIYWRDEGARARGGVRAVSHDESGCADNFANYV